MLRYNEETVFLDEPLLRHASLLPGPLTGKPKRANHSAAAWLLAMNDLQARQITNIRGPVFSACHQLCELVRWSDRAMLGNRGWYRQSGREVYSAGEDTRSNVIVVVDMISKPRGDVLKTLMSNVNCASAERCRHPFVEAKPHEVDAKVIHIDWKHAY